MKPLLPVGIGALALIGFADSAYLVVLDIQATSRTGALTASCDFAAGACETVARSHAASILGIPTAVLGAAYFAAVLGAAAVRILSGKWPFPALMPVMFVCALGFSAYLVHMMVFELSAICPFCMVAHAVSTVIVGSYAVSRWVDREGNRRQSAVGRQLAAES